MVRVILKLGFLISLVFGLYIIYPCIELISIALGKPLTDSFKNVTYVSNYDGDTFTVNLTNLPGVFGAAIPVRVAHIDTAEIDSKNPCERASALLARSKLGSMLQVAKQVDLNNVKRDKYFRLLADVILDTNFNLAEYMLMFNLAVPYEGGSKPVVDWCKYPPNGASKPVVGGCKYNPNKK